MPAPKNAQHPPDTITLRDDEVVTWQGVLWRVRRTTGPHPSRWHEGRTYGPLDGMRWDPHPDPLGDHPGCSVLYAGATPFTCLAEVGWSRKAVDPTTGAPYLTAWTPTRALRLLDLTADGTWALRHGASASLHARPRTVCRAWARGAHRLVDPGTGGRLDGILTASTVFGQVAVLFAPADDSYPPAPAYTAPLTDPAVAATIIAPFVDRTGWRLT